MNSPSTEEEKPTSPILMRICKPLAVIAIIIGVLLLLYVFLSPTSPRNIVGGVKLRKKMGGGCPCNATS